MSSTARSALPDVVAGFCSLALVMGIARFGYTPLLPPMSEGLGLSATEGGALAAVNFAGYLSGGLAAGFVRRVAHQAFLYRLGLVVAVVTTLLGAVVEDYGLWAVMRFLSGLSSAAGMVLGSGLVLLRLLPLGRSDWMGWHYAGVGSGLFLCTCLVLGSAALVDWHGQWGVIGLAGLVLALPAWRLGRVPETARQGKRAGETPPLPWRRLSVILPAYFCAGFGFAVPGAFLVAAVEGLEGLSGYGLWAWAAVGLAAAPCTVIWTRTASRLGDPVAILLAYGVQATGILLPALSTHPAAVLGGAALYGLTFMGIVAMMMAHVGRLSPGNPAKLIGPMTACYGVGQVTGPALAGWMADRYGGFTEAFLLTTGLVGAGALLLAGLWMAAGSQPTDSSP